VAASEVRAKRLPGTARIIALAAAVLIGASGSLDQGHTAHAADAPLPPASAAAVAAERAPTFEDLLENRSKQLQATAAQVDQVRFQSLLAKHEKRERKVASDIEAELTRLKDLSRFTWPTKGGVASGFGMRKHPILGSMRLHNGADIGGACGNPIYATQSGTVTRANFSRSGKNVETSYLNMSKYAVSAGQSVTKGDVIGYVGTTGLSTACHLHLALYENGKGADPVPYLVKD
jgi:murein DD-endopeptidase MepM/ murein hydrolase activator NlpD